MHQSTKISALLACLLAFFLSSCRFRSYPLLRTNSKSAAPLPLPYMLCETTHISKIHTHALRLNPLIDCWLTMPHIDWRVLSSPLPSSPPPHSQLWRASLLLLLPSMPPPLPPHRPIPRRLKGHTVRRHAVLPVGAPLEAPFTQVHVLSMARAAVPADGPRADGAAAVRAEDPEREGGGVQEVVQDHGLVVSC